MSQGDSKEMNDYPLRAGNGEYDNSNDTFRIFFCSDTFASIDEDSVNPKLADVTQVGGGNFPIAGIVLTSVTWTRAAAISKLDFDDLTTIDKDGANPADIRTAVIVNDTSTNDDIYKAVDLTVDGSTPIDVINNDFDYAVASGGSMTGTVV